MCGGQIALSNLQFLFYLALKLWFYVFVSSRNKYLRLGTKPGYCLLSYTQILQSELIMCVWRKFVKHQVEVFEQSGLVHAPSAVHQKRCHVMSRLTSFAQIPLAQFMNPPILQVLSLLRSFSEAEILSQEALFRRCTFSLNNRDVMVKCTNNVLFGK